MNSLAPEKVYEPKGGGWDELKSEWVSFHNHKQYLLPVVVRHQTIKPIFEGDSLHVEVQCKDENLGPLVDAFAALVLEAKETEAIADEDSVMQFFKLMKHLLAYNYAFTDEQLQALLTVTPAQFDVLFQSVVRHINRK